MATGETNGRGRMVPGWLETADRDRVPDGSFTDEPHHYVIREAGVAEPIASCDYLVDAQRIAVALAAQERKNL